jgi:hypothetical protein
MESQSNILNDILEMQLIMFNNHFVQISFLENCQIYDILYMYHILYILAILFLLLFA